MANRILEPFIRLYDRWRTARALDNLDTRLLEDAGLKVEKTPIRISIFDKNGFYIGRPGK